MAAAAVFRNDAADADRYRADVHFATPLAARRCTARLLTVKATVPVGDLPVTVDVNVTLPPTVDGLIEVVSAVLVAPTLAEETWTVASVAVSAGTLMVIPYVLSV
jgi:hypothetical protein